jgi:hypothetical protein
MYLLTSSCSLDADLLVRQFGFFILIVGCVLASLKGVMTNMVLVGTGAVHPLYVLYLVRDVAASPLKVARNAPTHLDPHVQMSPLALVQMLAMAVLFGEVSGLVEAWDTLPISLCATMILGTAVMVRCTVACVNSCASHALTAVGNGSGLLLERRQLQLEQDHVSRYRVGRRLL